MTSIRFSNLFLLLVYDLLLNFSEAFATKRYLKRVLLKRKFKEQFTGFADHRYFTVHRECHTTLCSIVPCQDYAQVSMGLVGASIGGHYLEKKLKLEGMGASSVLTLFIAGMLSNTNLKLLPVQHPLYDLCWIKLLPLSLSFLLLAPKVENITKHSSESFQLEEETSPDRLKSKRNVGDIVVNLAPPFLLGALGSILGCILSYLLATKSMISKMLLMQREEALLACGSIAASYIGGSVNFFAAANILRESNGFESSTLLTSLAAADLILMALYFAFLSSCSSFSWVQKLFPEYVVDDNDDVDGEGSVEPDRTHSLGHLQLLMTFSGCFLIASALLRFSNICQDLFPVVPGLNCLFIVLFSSILRLILQTHLKFSRGVLFAITQMSSKMSTASFSLLYAAVGASANIRNALKNGVSSFIFAFCALLVHSIFIMITSSRYNNLFAETSDENIGQNVNKCRFRRLSLNEVLVASNCNIGGPATAAAFAGSVSKNYNLVVGATLWGTVGYAIGTSAGVMLTNFLNRVV